MIVGMLSSVLLVRFVLKFRMRDLVNQRARDRPPLGKDPRRQTDGSDGIHSAGPAERAKNRKCGCRVVHQKQDHRLKNPIVQMLMPYRDMQAMTKEDSWSERVKMHGMLHLHAWVSDLEGLDRVGTTSGVYACVLSPSRVFIHACGCSSQYDLFRA